jgi:hypothetical protein
MKLHKVLNLSSRVTACGRPVREQHSAEWYPQRAPPERVRATRDYVSCRECRRRAGY